MRFRVIDCTMRAPTHRQLDLIADIEEFVLEKFTGDTFEEASEYINRNMKRFKLETMDSWQYSYM